MIATLRFSLPDEQTEFDAACQAMSFKALAWDIDQKCRNLCKYGEPSEETRQFAEDIRHLIRESGVSLG